MKKSPLYTRTGDKGTTSLVNGARVAKNSPRVCAYGTLDELNAYIGLLQAHTSFLDNFVNETLLRVNNLLFNIGAYLADSSETLLISKKPLIHSIQWFHRYACSLFPAEVWEHPTLMSHALYAGEPNVTS